MLKNCPCYSQRLYKECCQPLHLGNPAINALALMRSRYSAYALGLADYIIKTTHRQNSDYLDNHKLWKEQILSFCKSTQFVNLTILEFIDGTEEAFVTFHAELKQNAYDTSFQEKSRFMKENQQWKYVSGKVNRVYNK